MLEGTWPTEVTNLMCNEMNMGTFVLTNQKRWACVIENWKRDDVLDLCDDQNAILSIPPAAVRAEILSEYV